MTYSPSTNQASETATIYQYGSSFLSFCCTSMTWRVQLLSTVIEKCYKIISVSKPDKIMLLCIHQGNWRQSGKIGKARKVQMYSYLQHQNIQFTTNIQFITDISRSNETLKYQFASRNARFHRPNQKESASRFTAGGTLGEVAEPPSAPPRPPCRDPGAPPTPCLRARHSSRVSVLLGS